MNVPHSQKPFVIPIFIPHAGCPHRCIFCDQTSTIGQAAKQSVFDQLDAQVTRFLGYRKDHHQYTEISFYGGNFLGLSTDNILFLLNYASKYISTGQIQGIRFSTRPDTITPERLNLLARFAVTTIEIGVQSMNDQVLINTRRGHTAQDVYKAVRQIKTTPYRLGLQMMPGLPGDTPETIMTTGKQLAELNPNFVRIYPTLVIKGSRLAKWYEQGRFSPLTLDEAVSLVKKLYVLFVRRQIKVIRMGLQPTDGLDKGGDLVAGPFHPAFGELVHSSLWLDAMGKEIQNANLSKQSLIIELHPKLISRIKGVKNQNIHRLSEEFFLPKISILKNSDLPLDIIHINSQPCKLFK